MYIYIYTHTHTHIYIYIHRGAEKSLARPGKKQANVSIRMAWISFGALPCRNRNLMTARVSILLKSRASLTCSELVSFLVGLRTYQHPLYILDADMSLAYICVCVYIYIYTYIFFVKSHNHIVFILIFICAIFFKISWQQLVYTSEVLNILS